MDETIRIAMWSGPRNISTAMMRAFENRADTDVVDEPFYAVYLAQTGIDHPMRPEILQAHETDWRKVASAISGAAPRGGAVFYQKHMTHHMIPAIGRGWMETCRHAFLIRDPARVVASYAAKRSTVGLDDIGFRQQLELFDLAAEMSGQAPPVVDADHLLQNPAGMLRALCAALGLPYDPRMLSWPAGRRSSDGVWAAHWYGSVERSTGFTSPPGPPVQLDGPLQAVADAAQPIYARLARFGLRPSPA